MLGVGGEEGPESTQRSEACLMPLCVVEGSE